MPDRFHPALPTKVEALARAVKWANEAEAVIKPGMVQNSSSAVLANTWAVLANALPDMRIIEHSAPEGMLLIPEDDFRMVCAGLCLLLGDLRSKEMKLTPDDIAHFSEIQAVITRNEDETTTIRLA